MIENEKMKVLELMVNADNIWMWFVAYGEDGGRLVEIVEDY